MKEFLASILASNGGIVATVVTVMVALNFVLSGLKSGLDKIKTMTKTTVDDKASDFLGKILAVLGKIIDWASANVEHK